MVSQFTIIITLVLNFDHNQILLGTYNMSYRCLNMPGIS